MKHFLSLFIHYAPIAFGTPKAVTRGAGFYTMDVTAGDLSGEIIEKFKDEFKDNTSTTGQDSSYATLVAGNIAAEFKSGFVTVEQNTNSSKSNSFNVEVEYEDINGSVELVSYPDSNAKGFRRSFSEAE